MPGDDPIRLIVVQAVADSKSGRLPLYFDRSSPHLKDVSRGDQRPQVCLPGLPRSRSRSHGAMTGYV